MSKRPICCSPRDASERSRSPRSTLLSIWLKPELLSYAITAEIVSTSKTHQTLRSTYTLWARLGNTDEQFARLLTTLDKVRQASTYLRSEAESDLNHAQRQVVVLHEMLNWVMGVVEQGQGPQVVHLLANRDIKAGELVTEDDLRLHSGNQRRRT